MYVMQTKLWENIIFCKHFENSRMTSIDAYYRETYNGTQFLN